MRQPQSAFRGERTLRAGLERADFKVSHVYGDWDQSPAALPRPG
jgi:hypothetical protein